MSDRRTVFSNSNGVTFGTTGGTVTASHNGLTTQTNQNLSLFATGNTTHNSSTVLNASTLLFNGLGGVTVGFSNGSVEVSGATGGAGAGDGYNIIAAGTQTANTTGTVVFSNSNGLAFGMSNSSVVTGSYTVPTVTNSSWSVTDNAGSGTVARLAFTNVNGVTLSLSTGAGGSHTIVGSHNALTSQSNQNVTAGNGGFAFQTLSFSNANNFSFGTSAGSAITGSYTVPTVTNSSWTASDNVTSVTVARLAFTNLNGVTLSLSTTTGGSATVVGSHNALTSQSNQALSAPNGSFTFQTAQFHNSNGLSWSTTTGSGIIGSHNGLTSQSNQAASASNGSFTFQTLGFSNANNVTFGTSAGSIVTASVAVGGGGFSAGVSNLGNTAGSTGVTGTRLVLVGTNNITLSQSTDANGGTVSISAPNPGGGAGATISAWPPLYPAKQTVITATIHSGVSGGTGGSTQWTYSGRLFPVDIPVQVNWRELYSHIGITATSAGTGSATNQLLLGIYSLNANTVLSLHTSYVWTHAMSQNSVTARTHRWGWGTNSTSNSTSLGGNVSATFTGTRQVIAHNTTESLSARQWYFNQVLLQRTSSVNVFAIVSLAEELGSASTSGYTIFGTNNLASRPGHWGGIFSTTTNTPAITVTAMPASIHTSAITLTNGASRWRPVHVQMLQSVT